MTALAAVESTTTDGRPTALRKADGHGWTVTIGDATTNHPDIPSAMAALRAVGATLFGTGATQ